MAPIVTTVLRGLKRRCPRCGEGRLFRRFYTLEERCAVCGLDFHGTEGDSWAFMYLGTAGLTGFVLIVLLLLRPLLVDASPGVQTAGRIGILLFALLLIPGTLPWRKGLALALGFLIDRATSPK